MRVCLLIVGVLVCLGLQPSLEARGSKSNTTKETTVDLSAKKNIFLGWVDLSPDQWTAKPLSNTSPISILLSIHDSSCAFAISESFNTASVVVPVE